MTRARLAAALALALLAAPGPAGATLYSFTDESGVTHYTNIPSDPRFAKVPGSTPPRVPSAEPLAAEKYDAEIARLSERHGVDCALVKAVIKAESNYDNRAISRAGALGLMQLMPETARERNVGNPFNPVENIEGGVRHLKYLLNTFDDLKLVLAAYNAGENAVRRYGGIPPFPETKGYVKTVLEHYGRYAGLVPASGAPGVKAALRPENTPQIHTFVNAEGTRVFTNEPWRYAEIPGWRRERTP
ncbi:MAG TPA: transglycosylase SLT domain-containing protein [bacterium]